MLKPPATEPRPGPQPGKVSLAELPLLVTTLCAALYLFIAPTVQRYRDCTIGTYDFGIYAHAFWNAAHGHGLWNSPESMDHLGSHASPLLYLLLPLYRLWPSPLTLLITGDVALVLAAVPAFLIARRRFGMILSWLCAVLWLAHPCLTSLAYDVHEVVLAVPLLLTAICLMDGFGRGRISLGRMALFIVVLLLAMGAKENVGLVAAMIGIYLTIKQRRFVFGALIVALGLGWTWLGIAVVIPHYGGNHLQNTMARFAYLGGDWRAILLSPVLRPTSFFSSLFSSASAQYLWRVLGPFGFLSLLAPVELLLALPDLAQNLLANHPPMRSCNFHYDALLLPGLYFALVVGLQRLSKLLNRLSPRLRQWPIVALAALLLCLAPWFHQRIGRGLDADFHDSDKHDDGEEIKELRAHVPPRVSVISPNEVQPYLADRRFSQSYSGQIAVSDRDRYDYVVLDVAGRSQESPPADPTDFPNYELVYRGVRYALLRRSAHAQ